jgi:hypothetical protein
MRKKNGRLINEVDNTYEYSAIDLGGIDTYIIIFELFV